MDALKFAFEIMIVGALALPWIAILIRVISLVPSVTPETEIDGLQSYLSVVPVQLRDAAATMVIIAIGYLAGSAVSRVSRNFFNDELWGSLPTENQIRSGVYYDEYCKTDMLKFLDAPTEFKGMDHERLPVWLCNQAKGDDPRTRISSVIAHKDTKGDTISFLWGDLVEEMFRLQESALLLRGEDKVDRLKNYFDQITVLRGAAFNGVILFVVCAFGILGNVRTLSSNHAVVRGLTFLPATAMVLYGAWRFYGHWNSAQDSVYTDPPLAELVLCLLGLVGGLIVWRAREAKFYLPTCAVALALTVVSYGGWWWTEVMYNLQVIHSEPELAQESSDGPWRAASPQSTKH